MIYLYTLKSQQDKYYADITINSKNNYFQSNNNGSVWSQKYEPIQLIEMMPNNDNNKYL